MPVARTSSFGQALQQRRKALDLTQQELAQQVGCAVVTIQRIEQGTLRPSRQIVQHLAAILDIPADEREQFVRLARSVPLPDTSEAQLGAPTRAPSTRSLLPMPLTPLIGRVQELTSLATLFLGDTVRLLTLTGPGGIGKTALAIQLAHALASHFHDGVVFVSLASLSNADLVIPAIGQALGLREAGKRPMAEQLHAHLRTRELLLLLDNFEQVVDAGTDVAALLGACSRLKCLATSRMPLHLSGEHQQPISPLALPPAEPQGVPRASGGNAAASVEDVQAFPAIALFIRRAQAARPDFALTEQNVPIVTAICQRLDGLPLAIELAAALVKVLPLPAILSRLEQRLHVLVGGPRDLPPRQQTLRTAITWSYNLLNADEQALFRRLAVFVGGWSLEAADAVSTLERSNGATSQESSVLKGLFSLVDHSLLQQVASDDEEPRYAMLETIREYALERLEASGEAEAIRQAHAAYFLALAEVGEAQLKSAGQAQWLLRLEREYANLRAALEWALGCGQLEMALRVCGALWHFWTMHGHLSEGRRWIEQALARSDPEPMDQPPISALAKTLVGAGMLAYRQADYGQARTLCEQSLRLYRQLGDQHGIATALHGLGRVTSLGGNYTAARAMYQESLAIYRALHAHWGIAYTNLYLGHATYFAGKVLDARPLIEESLNTFRTLGATWDIANTLFVRAVAVLLADYEAARAAAEESLALMRSLGDRRGIARASLILAHIAIERGDYRSPIRPLQESLGIFQELGERWFMTECMADVTGLTAYHHPEHAARLCGAVYALRDGLHSPIRGFYRSFLEHRLVLLRAKLDEATFHAAWEIGQAMTWDQAVDYALETLDLVDATVQHQLSGPPAPTSPRPAGSYPAGLSAREIEVLRLVALGLSDAEIAAQLVISRRTVNTHLSSIYSKLAVKSRTAAVHLARDHQLL